MGRIDVASLLAQVNLVALIEAQVKLKSAGKAEYSGLCPFHDESTPSFTVNVAKGFFHCFGCGAHGNAIEWVMRIKGCDFREACSELGAGEIEHISMPRPMPKLRASDPPWVPLLPVPVDAPPLMSEGAHRTCEIWNPKRERMTQFSPARVDAYRDMDGQLLGYVLRVEIVDRDSGKKIKITPTITWCVGPSGQQGWCIRPFPVPRPMFGLEALAAKPSAPVLMVEGEKCREAGASALPPYATLSWPGGSKGLAYVDFAPLLNRDLVLWPDADLAGVQAMLGYQDRHGLWHDGIAQRAWRAGARSIRLIDVDGQPKGWDIADALDPLGDAWTTAQLCAWAANRVHPVEVTFDPKARAA